MQIPFPHRGRIRAGLRLGVALLLFSTFLLSMSVRDSAVWIWALLWLTGCANITPPTGGEKDTVPPKLVKSVPAPKTTNYPGKHISLEFDERIDAKTLQIELLITPLTTVPYKADVHKNLLTLTFERDLEPNTTYTFNFRGSVTDITEQNKALQTTLTFSTGPYLDSGIVAGNVKQWVTQQLEQDISVLLHRLSDTGTVRTAPPYYAARTDAAGSYRFENIAGGRYRLYALADQNNNFLYDQDKERIGYLIDTVAVADTIVRADLKTVQFDSCPPILLNRKEEPDKLRLSYNEGLSAFQIRSMPALQIPFITGSAPTKGRHSCSAPLNKQAFRLLLPLQTAQER